jgi:HlyD family secretion protein
VKKFIKASIRGVTAAIVIGLGVWAWWYFQPQDLPDGFAAGNGRIEAVEIDIAARTAGRIREILANEGDFVRAGQILAKMDTAVLEAQLREAEAQLQRALIGIETAQSLVTQPGSSPQKMPPPRRSSMTTAPRLRRRRLRSVPQRRRRRPRKPP